MAHSYALVNGRTRKKITAALYSECAVNTSTCLTASMALHSPFYLSLSPSLSPSLLWHDPSLKQTYRQGGKKDSLSREHDVLSSKSESTASLLVLIRLFITEHPHAFRAARRHGFQFKREAPCTALTRELYSSVVACTAPRSLIITWSLHIYLGVVCSLLFPPPRLSNFACLSLVDPLPQFASSAVMFVWIAW